MQVFTKNIFLYFSGKYFNAIHQLRMKILEEYINKGVRAKNTFLEKISEIIGD